MMCRRWLVVGFYLSLLASLCALASAQQSSSPQPKPGSANKAGMYTGPGGCAASNCHGSVQPKNVTRIPQNEYSIWAAQDKHSRATQVLSNAVSLRMAKILKINQPNTEHKCLACHAADVSPELRAETFHLEDGVSCESCHGPAVGWLGPHTTRNWTHEQSIKAGMYDLRDNIHRSERCVGCHVGTPEKQVDHEMIAAGHPDLTFELDTYSSAMPRHWRPTRESEAWSDVREWAVGQAVQLREALNRLDRRVSGPNWPEFAEMDCFACHHSLTRPEDSWRQARGYPDRRAGSTEWNAARYVVFRHIVSQVNPDLASKLDAELATLTDLVGKWSSHDKVEASAKQAAQLADQAAQQLNSQKYDQQLTQRVMQAIAGDGTNIANTGERSAEQAAMALDSLAVAFGKNSSTKNLTELRSSINELFKQLNNPSAYNAPQFAAQLQKVRAQLPQGGSGVAGNR